MSDYFAYMLDRNAHQQIEERVRHAQRPRLPGHRRYARRHTLATRLHRLADRIDV